MSIVVQLQTIAFMTLCGAAMGVGFDTYHVCKGKGRFPLWVVFILDVLFWLASVGVVFYVLVEVNNGVVRFPIFIGMIVGAWVYFVLGSKKYIQLLLTVIKFCKWLYRAILQLIDLMLVKPVMLLFQLIWMTVMFIVSLLVKLGKILWKVIFFILTPFAKMGRNLGKSISNGWAGFTKRLQKWFTKREK